MTGVRTNGGALAGRRTPRRRHDQGTGNAFEAVGRRIATSKRVRPDPSRERPDGTSDFRVPVREIPGEVGGVRLEGSRSNRSSTRSNRRSQSGGGGPRSSSSAKRSEQDLPDYSIIDPSEIDEAVDVYVDAPVVKVDQIKFELDDLRAHLAVLAEAGQFVQINAGAGVRLGKVELDIQGVEAQALLEARLRNVTKILARVLTTLDRNPELLQSVGEALGDVGGGAHDLLTDTGDVVRTAGKGAQSAVQDVGRGAGQGVAGIGRGAQQGVEGVGQGAGQGVEGVGQGAEQGLQSLGQGGRRQGGAPQNGG